MRLEILEIAIRQCRFVRSIQDHLRHVTGVERSCRQRDADKQTLLTFDGTLFVDMSKEIPPPGDALGRSDPPILGN